MLDSLRKASWSQPPKKISLEELRFPLEFHMQPSMAPNPHQQSRQSFALSKSSSASHLTAKPDTPAQTLRHSSFPGSHKSSTASSSGYLALSRALPGGHTATAFRVHGASLVCKLFGPAEGSGEGGEDREEGDWLADFKSEAFAYSSLLRDLQGSVIPRCYGAYTSTSASMALLVLDYCGERIPHASTDPDMFRKEDG